MWPGKFPDLVSKTTRLPGDHLAFRTTGFAGNRTVDLIPWFRLTNERYNLYWHQS